MDSEPGDRLPFPQSLARGGRSTPTRRPANGLETGVEVPGPSSIPIVWPGVDVGVGGQVDGSEHADRRGDDHPFGDEEALAVVE